MSTYYALACKECRTKVNFITTACGYAMMGDEKQSERISKWFGKHAGHKEEIVILSEHEPEYDEILDDPDSQQKGGEEPCATQLQTIAPATDSATMKNASALSTEVASNAAPTSEPEGAATMFCPFCGEDDFDARGLKHHLLRHCATFGYTPIIQ